MCTVSLAQNTSKSVPNTFCDTHTSAGDLTGVRNTECGVSACESGQMRVSHAHCVRVGSSAKHFHELLDDNCIWNIWINNLF